MGFQWACFLSYRHSNEGLALVEAVHDQLKFELEVAHELRLYCDVRNEPGTRYNELIAETLCTSACMVMLYWPAYFSTQHLYCTREYLAMVRLEKQRLAMLPESQRHFGLIIPVLIRSSGDEPPGDLKSRYHEDFTQLSLSPNMRKTGRFKQRVLGIAEYIRARYHAFSAVNDPCAGCGDFALPSDDEARDWLKSQPRPPGPPPFIRNGGR